MVVRRLFAAMRGDGKQLLLGVLACSVALCCLGFLGSAVAGDSSSATIRSGRVGKYHWFVHAASDRGPGICLEVGTYIRRAGGVNGGGQCSAPAPKRGIVLAGVRPRRGNPKLTAVGGAFNRAVATVKEVSFDNTTRTLPLGIREADLKGTHLGRYRYMAFSVRGPWCVKELDTYDADGNLLWHATFRELASIPSEMFYDPKKVC